MDVSNVSDTERLWFRRYHPTSDAPARLICFPHAGGAATFFTPVARALAPETDVLAVQYPGRQDRRDEPGINDIPTLADAIVRVMGPLLDRPVAFFGHSMGALVAYEVARRLPDDHAGMLVRLFASGRRAPSRYRDENVRLMTDDDLLAEVSTLGALDPRLTADDEMRALVLPALRNDYHAVETYHHAPSRPLPCPVTVLTGDQDPKTTLAEARDWKYHAPPDGFDIHVFPGGHFYLSTSTAEVLDVLTTALLPYRRPRDDGRSVTVPSGH